MRKDESDLKLEQLETKRKQLLDPVKYKHLSESFTMTNMAARISCTQGPGAYNVDSSFRAVSRHVPAAKLRPSSQSSKLYNNKSPGPAHYESQKRDYSGGYMSLVPFKPDPMRTAPEVGPGYYAIDRQKSKPNFTFGSRINIEKQNTDAGPGTYDVASILDRKRGAQFTMKGKPAEKVEISPGPCSYNVLMRSANDMKRGHKFCSEKKEEKIIFNTPGAGDYDVSRKDRGPKFTMGTRTFGDHL
ncbi:SHIPPO_1-like protein [Hexamita inflata]|uniref:SHIPPO 1-like protein n=1 Tax=Hexamita inflata TaxID=28002 RepID=A0AA86QYL8_9EUKA|nr:SHIPPO 1-like protein [Hexamita inflata]CAI9967005.1 SHIPPO 1-like protein [Hexamita inflata]